MCDPPSPSGIFKKLDSHNTGFIEFDFNQVRPEPVQVSQQSLV